MLLLVNGNKFKIDRQQHNRASNFVSANSLIAKFIRYDASSIASLCIEFEENIEKIVTKKCFFLIFQIKQKSFKID